MLFFVILLAIGYIVLFWQWHRLRQAKRVIGAWHELHDAIFAHFRDNDFTIADWHALLPVCRMVDKRYDSCIRPFKNDSCEIFVLDILRTLRDDPEMAR
ncbi:MAG: hypothetical protein ABSC29_01650 [Minisyncoccia bacterium]|jgi:hypothetical protein